MPERLLSTEFRDALEHTRYPFADSALLQTTGAGQAIEVDTFLDASLYPIGAKGRLYLATIDISTREAVLSLGDEERNQVRATGSFDLLDPPSIVQFVDIWGRPAGMLVSEPMRLARFSAWPTGLHEFEFGQTEFAASVVIPTPEICVRGFLLEDGSLLTGDIWILGDDGVVVREVDDDIRIDIVGDPLFVRHLCGQLDRFVSPTFVKTINGCPPDENGNFELTVGDHFNPETILRIYADGDGLVIAAIGQTSSPE